MLKRKKKRLAVDFDDAVVDFSRAFLLHCKKHYHVSHEHEDFNDPDFLKIWGITKRELIYRLRAFVQGEAHGEINLLPGAKVMLERLSEVYELHLVTNRAIEMEPYTRQLIEKLCPNVFAEMHFCTKDWGSSHRTYKNRVCKEEGIPILIDDHPNNVRECAADGIHVYLIERLWNQDEEFSLFPGAIVRVSGWEDPILSTLL